MWTPFPKCVGTQCWLGLSLGGKTAESAVFMRGFHYKKRILEAAVSAVNL